MSRANVRYPVDRQLHFDGPDSTGARAFTAVAATTALEH